MKGLEKTWFSPILQLYHSTREIKLCLEAFEMVEKGQLFWERMRISSPFLSLSSHISHHLKVWCKLALMGKIEIKHMHTLYWCIPNGSSSSRVCHNRTQGVNSVCLYTCTSALNTLSVLFLKNYCCQENIYCCCFGVHWKENEKVCVSDKPSRIGWWGEKVTTVALHLHPNQETLH